VEIRADLRQRHVDDEQVEAGEHDTGADDHEHEPGRGVCAGAAEELT
jgi:hypothetical protein